MMFQRVTALKLLFFIITEPHEIRKSPVPARDLDGLDALPYQRSPTGLLYGWPLLPTETKETESGWIYSGSIEIGATHLSGDEDAAWLLKYKDLDTGAYLNNFSIQADQPDTARFFEMQGGGAGYRDQFFGAKTGRHNDWRLKLFYRETPHVFTGNYRSLWTGLGSDQLTLDQLTAGGTVNAATTAANIQDQLSLIENGRLSIVRRKGGVDLQKQINNQWRLYGAYTLEQREGERPFGAVFGGGGGGGNLEIPESIDYDTHDLVAGLRFDNGRDTLNLQTQASLFRNNTGTMSFANPLFINTNTIQGIPQTSFKTGVYDLYPDNDFYNLLAEYGRSFQDEYRTRLTLVASLSQMRQDDQLIPPTTLPLDGGLINGVSTANVWNTPRSLSRESADAQIDTRLFSIGLATNPLDRLSVQGKVRYYETDNKTDYFACNPLTGQWGRLLNDGSGGSFVVPNATNNPAGTLPNAYNLAGCSFEATRALGLVPSAGNVKLRNTPYEYKQINYSLSGDYRLGRASSLNATLEREEFDREYRERDRTWENRIELGYTNRGFDFGSLRLTVEYAERRGDDYTLEAHHEAQSAILGPLPSANGTNVASWIHAMSGLRKFDLADRNRAKLAGRLNLIASEAIDVGLFAEYQENDYPNSDYGRNDRQTLGAVGLDLNYQPSARFGLSGFYTYQQGHMSQAGIQANSCIIGNYYYFFSDGSIATNTTGRVPGPVDPSARLIDQTRVTASNWQGVCGNASPTSPLFNTSRMWETESDEYNHTFGLGGRYDFGKARLELDYTYVTGVTEIGYRYNAAALGITNPQQLALIGTGMPDLETTQHFVDLNLIVPIKKSLAIRALYRYEGGEIEDWHYDGVAQNPVPVNNAAYLDSGTQNYHANLVGLFLQMSF
ncbi:MAG: hypothetical protein EOM91_05385 [Sphingobacteriia bacterium]|nr:hypothetical protein [Sphingobacteriia bacterium]NCC38564.1 hypothetical protein [Gammaproteobacteria bacterium]